MVEEVEFRDEAEFQETVKYSIKEIILRQIRKIGDMCCREFTGGYWEKKPMRTSAGIMFSEVYHNDLREAYCNAVDFLIDIIYPLGDDDLKKYLKDNEGFDGDVQEFKDVKDKLIHKKKTFRQINLMFERVNFWSGSGGYDE